MASGTTLVFGATAILGTWATASLDPSRPDAFVAAAVALAAASVAVALVVRTQRHAVAGEAIAAFVLLPAALTAVWIVGASLDEGIGAPLAVTVAAVLVVVTASLLRDLPVAADLLRGTGAAIALLGLDGPAGLDGAVDASLATVLVGAILTLEAFRLGRGHLLVVAGPVLVRAAAGLAFGVTDSRPWTGAVLLAVAIAAGMAATSQPGRRVAGALTATVALLPAIELLSLTPTALAWGTVGAGAAVVAGGLLARRPLVAHLGGVVTTLGTWQLLDLAGVDAVDAWLAAPAAQLWLAAVGARRAGRISSWAADVPPLALVLVPAVLERVAGGSGWHSAAAGALAVVAIVGGGVGRHGGPLVVGVGGMVVVVAIETLAVVAAVPTWAWLTVGGVVLLGAGALIERTGGAPVATARRLADVVAERFD
ncbi:MAG: hypothetical protein WEB09_08275 [Nitriliruptor sp.]